MGLMSRRRLLGSAAAAWGLAAASGSRARAARAPAGPPPTRVAPVTDRYWGVEVTDPYRWMEDKPDTAEFTAWLKAQGDYARGVLDALPDRADMARRLERFTADTEILRAVYSRQGRLFIERRPAGGESFLLYMRETQAGPERLILDTAAFAQAGGPSPAFDYMNVSPDGRHVAFGLSMGGSEMPRSLILNIDNGAITDLKLNYARAGAWLSDSSGLFYFRVREDAVPGSTDFYLDGASWLHRLGTDPASDQILFRVGEGPDYQPVEGDLPLIATSMDGGWILGVHYRNQEDLPLVYVTLEADLLAGRPAWRKVAGHEAGVADAAVDGDHIYLLAKGRQGAGEIVRVEAASQTFETGQVVVPAGEAVLSFMTLARDAVYVQHVKDGQGRLSRLSSDGTLTPIILPQTGSVWGAMADTREDGLWFQMDDLTRPASSYRLEAGANRPQRVVLSQPSPFDLDLFVTTRTEIRARDGAMVPVEILHRKDTPRDGSNPLLIQAYGAYGLISDPGYQPLTLAFLEAGGVFVYAHVRGGGEKGRAWHMAGYKASKANTWRDAIDCAEALIAQGWSRKGSVALWGISAGGIMVGRAITERPDLFAAAIGEVGVFNTLRMELTANGPGNDAEFGTVKKEDEFHALLAMDAYHAVKDGVAYPPVLTLTGANDRRVEPWQAGKFTARLQAASTNHPGAILRVDYDSGHFANTKAAGNAKRADIFAFVLAHTRRRSGRSRPG